MNNFTIGITTFSKRYDYLVKLISQIRSFNNSKIILSINGERGGEFDNEYRKNIMNLCASYDDVFPTFFIETRGLCKMWNTILVTSDTDYVLMLNDDIEIHSNEIFDVVSRLINDYNFNGLARINDSFSHFVVDKWVLDSIGYFDERLLGFGEEDGDITYRLLKKGINLQNIYSNNIINIVSGIRHDYIESGIGKYSKFNREYIYSKKYSPNLNSPYRGMFDFPMDQNINDLQQYPSEKFFRDNKNKL